MKITKYDYMIVGAGPAGIFAAYELIKRKRKPKILIIERGDRIENRKRSQAMLGFGGAGTYSDGKMHFTPVLSHKKALSLVTESEYVKLMNYVDEIFMKFGVGSDYYPKDINKVKGFVEKAQKEDIKLYIRKVKHVGSDKLGQVMKNFQDFLEDHDITILDNARVEKLLVERGKCAGVVLDDNKKIRAAKTLVAPGRVGAKWLQDLCGASGVECLFDKVEIGVRVEFPEAIMKEYSDLMYEAIFEMRTSHFDDIVRTYCPCPNGLVSIEDYGGYIGVNGHSNSNHDSVNSNFAFVTEIELTEPVENTTSYATSIAKLANTLGGGKPILQRLVDLRAGRRSTWTRINKSYVNPSNRDVTPGDIAMALPFRIVQNILEGLTKLDTVMPGINAGSTLLYAPEVKFRGSKVKTDSNLETTVKNFFVAGDGAGVSGNIIGAAATGIIAARGMMR